MFSGLVDTLGACREQAYDDAAACTAAVEREISAAMADGFREEARLDAPDHVGEILAAHVRPCARQIFAASPNAGRSYFGGQPLLTRDEPWPRCKRCHGPLTFLVQIDLEEAWSRCSAPIEELTLRPIERWEIADDVPGPEAICDLVDVEPWEARELRDQLTARGYPWRFEKLGGWPCWAQSVEHVDCHCGVTMAPVLQLETATAGADVLGGLMFYVFRCAGCGDMTIVCQR